MQKQKQKLKIRRKQKEDTSLDIDKLPPRIKRWLLSQSPEPLPYALQYRIPYREHRPEIHICPFCREVIRVKLTME